MANLDYRKFRWFVVHSKLDAEIGRQNSCLHQDTPRLTHLKKLRLAVKDQLSGHTKPANLEHSARDPLKGIGR
jgi:uncharacterized protein YdcH (DUF465 family)